jgi:hypothetical protein
MNQQDVLNLTAEQILDRLDEALDAIGAPRLVEPKAAPKVREYRFISGTAVDGTVYGRRRGEATCSSCFMIVNAQSVDSDGRCRDCA